MRAAALGESGRRGLEHEPHRRASAPQPGRVLSRHDTGVEMWEEVCLREHRLSGPTEILECRLASERVELFSGGSVTQLGLVAEGEQRFAAAGRCAGASDVEDLVDAQVCPLASARRAGEGAVVTDVAAELRQRDEDLRRIGEQPAWGPLT